MAIKEVEIEGKKYFEVTVHARSKVNRKIRCQRKRTRIEFLKQAQIAEKELERECWSEVARLEGSGLPWGELLEKYELAHRQGLVGVKKIQLNTIWDTVATLRRFTAEWESTFCKDITPRDVRVILQNMMDEGYSHSRLRAVKSGINSVFKWGIEEGAIVGARHSPTLSIELEKNKDEKPPQILSLPEIQKLLDAAMSMDNEWYPIWFMALNTGMRSGELFALEWKDIDFENRLITVSKSYNGRLKAIKSTKAGYWRKVPMNAALESFLIERKQKWSDDPHVLPRIGNWRRGEAARILREFCEGIGINSVCFHALRACFATHLLNAGISSPVVKKICGWTDEKVMSRYIRLSGVDVAGATEKLGFALPEASRSAVVNLVDFRANRQNEEKEI